MNDRELDRALSQTPQVDPAVLRGIANAIVPNLRPVRPLSPPVLAAQLIAVSAAAAFAGAGVLGFKGIQRLSAVQSAAIFPAVALFICLAAALSTAAIIPGARQRVRPAVLVALACAALAGIFALVFHDYSTAGFVREGVRCLTAGVANAIPAALLAWIVLRRGFAVNATAAGAAAGALAGLAGILMLELHCPLLQAPHAMLWHVAVIPICGAVGALLPRIAPARSARTPE
jgi:hypothetical protein